MSDEPDRDPDVQDPLTSFRSRFVIDDELIYLDGNSLGRLPKATIDAVRSVVEGEWGHELVLGWDHWIDMGQEVGNRLATIVGASEGEVALCDQTSVNLFKVAHAALAASGRNNVVTDRGNFPSDRYVLEAIANSRGGKLIFVPEDPTLDQLAEAVDDSVGVVSLSHVAYRSGAMLDGADVTGLVHRGGALMVWDLSHSVGSVPVALNEWAADFAVGCTYKYLNGGPGAPAFLYVRADLVAAVEQPIPGWFSHTDQFAMAPDYEPSPSIRRFVVGTPPILSLVAAKVGIDLTIEAGIDAIRRRGIALTSAFAERIDTMHAHGFTMVTPADPSRRGSHISVRHNDAYRISQALRTRNVIPDFRAPDLIRFGFAPLYTTFAEVDTALDILEDIMNTGSYKNFPRGRTGVT